MAAAPATTVRSRPSPATRQPMQRRTFRRSPRASSPRRLEHRLGNVVALERCGDPGGVAGQLAPVDVAWAGQGNVENVVDAPGIGGEQHDTVPQTDRLAN